MQDTIADLIIQIDPGHLPNKWGEKFSDGSHARMRWPSDRQIESLKELQLCTRRDIEACESHVRRLCKDLPDFDSVWVDALVQRRVLTPWQADVLQSTSPERLRVGRYVLTDTLGSQTFTGHVVGEESSVILQQLAGSSDEDGDRINGQMHDLIRQLDELRQTTPSSIALPKQMEFNSEEDSFLVTNCVSGWSTDELLIRGGRLTWETVSEIGRQLLTAIQWLESHRLIHGEIVARNLRLTTSGNTVLVAPFVARYLRPHVSYTTSQKLRNVETTAPELVGAGLQPDSRSELYAVGCLLWQLLTSRPVFLSADPVNRLLQATRQDVPDVRTVVSDCPDWLARQIHSFTRRSPELRPATTEKALSDWQKHSRHGVAATKTILKRLPSRSRNQSFGSPGSHRRKSSQIWPTVGAVAIMLVAFGWYGVQRGLLPSPLELQSTRVSDRTRPVSEDASLTDRVSDFELQDTVGNIARVPLPDPAGVVSLQSGAIYSARDLEFAGVMHVETTGEDGAVILTNGIEPWKISASQVVISNIQVRTGLSDVSPIQSDRTAVDVDCECDVLSLRDCIFDSDSPNSLRWQPRSDIARVIRIRDCVFAGEGYGVWLSRAPERCELNNVLFTKHGAAMRCDFSLPASQLRLLTNRVSQIGGSGFIDIFTDGTASAEVFVQIVAGESVLAPSNGLVRLATSEQATGDAHRVEFLLPERGNPTIVPPYVHPAVRFDRSLGQLVKLPEAQLLTESILIAKPLFRGTSNSSEANDFSEFELLDYEGPKLSPDMPGIVAAELPNKISVGTQH